MSINRKLVKLWRIQKIEYKMATKRNEVALYVCDDMERSPRYTNKKNSLSKKKVGGVLSSAAMKGKKCISAIPFCPPKEL